MAKFTYGDLVRVSPQAPAELRPGNSASVIAVFETRPTGSHFAAFPMGVIYSVEFENGDAIDVHEENLDAAE